MYSKSKVICGLLLLPFVCVPALGQDIITQNQERIRLALTSQDVNVRRDAYIEIQNSRELAVKHFVLELEDDRFWNDVDATGIAASGLYLIRKLRISEVVEQLVDHIDWSVNAQTYKSGFGRNRDAQYGVVLALISIAGPEVKKHVVKKLRVTTDVKQRLFFLWVLHETEGDSLPFILDKEIERNVFDNEKANLLAAKAEIPDLGDKWNNFLFIGKLDVPVAP